MGKISYWRIAMILVAVVASFASAYFFSDALRVAEKPSEYIGVVFSLMAASLFAVISIVGDPSMMLPGSTRVGWESAKQIQIELQKFNFLFLWYLVTLGLLVISEIVESERAASLYWIFDVFTFFATFGFIVSLALPFQFSEIQRSRLQQEIDSRKASPQKK